MRELASLLLLALSLAACATTSAAATTAPPPSAALPPQWTPRDVHGDPAALLPPSPIAWIRVETARARQSRHWPLVTATITNSGSGAYVQRFVRELGFDPIATSTRAAAALYERIADPESVPRAVVVVRDGFDPERVRAALASDGRTVREERVRTLTVVSNGRYAVSFLAQDVLIAFHPAMADALERQLTGQEPRVASEDPAFAPLWQRAGARPNAVVSTASVDTAPIEVDGVLGVRVAIPGFARVVSSVDGDDALSVRVVALGESAAQSAQFVARLDAVRRDLGGRFLVRLMGLGRLLSDGVALSTDDAYVRAAIDAQGSEVERALQLVSSGGALR